jgi:hypothetical protein
MLFVVWSPFSTLHAQMGGGGGMGGGGTQANMGNGMGAMMLVSGGTAYRGDGTRVTMDDGVAIATRYLTSTGINALALDEIEEWEFNYYVVVKEAAPSTYKAYQLIIDKWTGAVLPEPGPNMAWNQKYGRMMNNISDGMGGGMKKRERKMNDPNMTVTVQAATSAANQFLRERFSKSLAVDGPPDVYFGYYNFDVNDAVTGAKYGMLSVNGSTSQVWYHTWHGNFVQGKELN